MHSGLSVDVQVVEMIEKECAIEIQRHALQAITELTKLFNQSQGRCSAEKYEELR